MKRADVTVAETASTVNCDLAGEVLRSFGSLHFPAIGRSMVPAIWPGDTLVVESVVPQQVQTGDVIVTGRHGVLRGHRVIGVEGDSKNRQWITQGDALPVPDLPVFENELLGRVTYVIRAGRLIPMPADLNLAKRLTAKLVRSSAPAARALVLIHRIIHAREKLASKDAVPCQS
jgi:signal peptidase I